MLIMINDNFFRIVIIMEKNSIEHYASSLNKESYSQLVVNAMH